MRAYPRLTRARRLRCQICGQTLDRDQRFSHVADHARDGRWFGIESLAIVFRGADRASQ